MGLDTVELVIEVEDEFNIPLPDELVEGVLTVGDLEAVVTQRLAAADIPFREAEVWNRLVEAIVRSTGVERSAVVRTARFVADLGLD